MKDKIFLNNDFQFSPEFDEKMLSLKFKGKLEQVRIPHTVAETPFNNFSPEIYQKVSLYRTTFLTQPSWNSKRIILTVDGAAHMSEVFLNGESLLVHKCGYTAFSADLTEHLLPQGKENVLAIKVDSRESNNFPPFGLVIDYMTYGGIYRDVYLEIKNPVYIKDVFVKTKNNHFESEITLSGPAEGYTISQRIVSAAEEDEGIAERISAQISTGVPGEKVLTSADADHIVAWSLENPALYYAITELLNEKGKIVDTHKVRFGFRDILFNEQGFFLNGKKIKLRGLNRHQSYPYVGYAMPASMQRDDADILKYELGLNEVRTSHYPQSHHFIDRCDEIGLLVFTEIPGWQHIGDYEWKEQAVINTRDMVLQWRNHPSIFMWGVRINESPDDDELFKATNAAARELDPTRPTAGVRNFAHSHFFEDVYTYNDFSHTGNNDGVRPKKEITKSSGGYMVTEYNGHMYPTKSFDDELHRMRHALRHAKVINDVAARDDIGGSSGWCAFDYNTHKEFGAGDYICYHGVMDMFRNPKLAASVYQSQQSAEIAGDVLEISSSMDLGEYPAGTREAVWIFTNADSVKFYVNGTFIKEFTAKDSEYKSLAHGPIFVDDFIGSRLEDDYNIPHKKAEDIKKVLHAALWYGMNNLPKNVTATALKLAATRTTNMRQMMEFFSRYLGNLGAGGSVTTSYTFEAYRGGKLVKTVVKGPARLTQVSATVRRSVLIETQTYDVAEVNLCAVDEKSNVQHYCQEAVLLETEGPIELIGPAAVSLKGGTAGAYVRTTGKAGKAALKITDWCGNTLRVPLTVKIQRV